MALQDEIRHVEALKFQASRVAPSWLSLLSACGSSCEFSAGVQVTGCQLPQLQQRGP